MPGAVDAGRDGVGLAHGKLHRDVGPPAVSRRLCPLCKRCSSRYITKLAIGVGVADEEILRDTVCRVVDVSTVGRLVPTVRPLPAREPIVGGTAVGSLLLLLSHAGWRIVVETGVRRSCRVGAGLYCCRSAAKGL